MICRCIVCALTVLGLGFTDAAHAASPAPLMDASIQARLASCDKAVARIAIDQLTGDPRTLQEPLMLFFAASAERALGRKEEAAFWYLAARLRTGRQLLFERGDRSQLLAVMDMTVGADVMPMLQADPELARRLVERVQQWDRATPDPFRDREDAKSGDVRTKLAAHDAGLRALPEQLAKDPAAIAQARAAEQARDRLEPELRARRCGPGTLDAVDAEAASTKIKADAEKLVMVHPLVVQRAGGVVKSANTGAYRTGQAGLPSRLTISVQPATGKSFYAEVDVEPSITAERKLGPVKLTLDCVTDLWIGQRDASWKDVCAGDANAMRPSGSTTDLRQYSSIAAAKYPDAPKCEIPDLKLPTDFAVLAAGDYTGRTVGFQIDQSGHEATRIDVSVNMPGKPVVLMLGAYEPTIWNVAWTRETKILAALVGGYHRQAVAGLDKSTPLLVSTFDNKGPCGYFYITPRDLDSLNPLSKRMFGRPVDMVYPAKEGAVIVGDPLPQGVKLVASRDTLPESFRDNAAPLAGAMGLADAVRKGLIRKATAADADAWVEAAMRSAPSRDVPPVAGQGIPKPRRPNLYNGYVVLGPFTYPAGLYGAHSATFFIPKGVPKPQGNPGHSAIHDFNALPSQ